MATQELARKSNRPTFTPEQHEAWQKAKLYLKHLINTDTLKYRALHIAMSELRGRYRTHKGPIETMSKNPNKSKQRYILDSYDGLRTRVDTWKAYLENPGSKKLFVLVDNNLSPSQQAVQASHAVALFQKENPLAPWVNGTLVLLTIDPAYKQRYAVDRGEYTFEQCLSKFASGWSFSSLWREEDLDNRPTAFAVMDEYSDLGTIIKGTKLL